MLDRIWVFTAGDPEPDVLAQLVEWTHQGRSFVVVPVRGMPGDVFPLQLGMERE